MRIPMKVDYGVRALVDLATHQEVNGSTSVATAIIAQRQQIPKQYLDRILLSLKPVSYTHLPLPTNREV